MMAPNVLKQLSGKWKLELLFLMKDQPRRWSELNHLLPQASPNALTRQLRELGLSCCIHGVTPGERITGDDFDFSFLPEDFAPEEPLLPCEAVRSILFSGDYFCQAGDSAGRPLPLQWKRIVRFVGLRQIPQRQRLHRLRQQLLGQKPNLAAPAHGRVLRCL